VLAQGCGRLELQHKQVALVLDASESAQLYRDDILRLAGQLLERLPRNIGKKVYFLGNSHEYDGSGLPHEGNRWWHENSMRGSLLAPVIENLKADSLLIIGAGTIYDYDDWADVLRERLHIARMGERPLTPLPDELNNPDFSQLLPLLHDPILSVEITGRSFMPYLWDNGSYQLVIEEECVKLTGTGQPNTEVAVCYWGSDVTAAVHTHNGARHVSLQFAELKPETTWKSFTPAETEAFRNAVSGLDFVCPVCGNQHPASTLRCTAGGSILGSPVYPSLANFKGIIIVSITDSGALFRFHAMNVLKLGEEQCLVVRNARKQLFSYDAAESTWRPVGEMQPYYRTKEGYVLVM
jgi:hypothetical protein